MTQRECSKLHYFADKRQLPHSGDNAVHVYATKLWGYMLVLPLLFPCSFLVHSLLIPCSFLALRLLFPYMWTAYVSRRLRWLRRVNTASCIISQTKDSCLIVETMQFMFMQQSCERTCLLIPYSSLALSLLFPYMFNGHVSRRSRWLRRENAASCIISQRKDSCHIVETMQFMFMQQSCEVICLFFPCSSLALSLFIPCSFLAHSLLFACSFLTCERPMSPADYADYAEWIQQAALFRRQKTVAS